MVSLRMVLLLSAWAAAGLGNITLAAHQVAFTIWNVLTFALDALAIVAQAMTRAPVGRRGRRRDPWATARWCSW
jgi:Na+-driven multidrug efflux pump